MKHFLFISFISLVMFSCTGQPEAGEKASDTAVVVPDSVPQMVRIGKEADWPYKPDTMINELLLADANSMREYKRMNGNTGEKADSDINALLYVNTLETEQLTVIEEKVGGQFCATRYVVKRNIRDKKSPAASNYATARNFITSAGIYIGMPQDYVQTVYKSQDMMRWVKGDTTYLGYGPKDKDKEHYKRYPVDSYSATYKFVDDKCIWIEAKVEAENIVK